MTTNYPTLNNAPIVEAKLEIQVRPRVDLDGSELLNLHSIGTMPITIATLNNGHLDEYTRLLVRAVTEHPTFFQSSASDVTGNAIVLEAANAESFVLGAFNDDGKMVGTVAFHRITRPKAAHKATIYRMYVCREMEGRGIGRALLEETLKRALAQAGLETIILAVTAINFRAKTLYSHAGFKPFATEWHSIKIGGRYYDEEWMMLKVGDEVREKYHAAQ